MANRELRKFGRDLRAAMAAEVAGLLLAGVVVWSVIENRGVVTPRSIGWAMCVTLLSPVLGVVGTSVRSLDRASLTGAMIVGLPVAILLLLLRLGIREKIWLLAAASSFGSILAQVGAWAGGSLAEGTESPQAKQFTLRQIMVFFIPVAVFLGYVSGHVQK
jgi:hypothetical protein